MVICRQVKRRSVLVLSCCRLMDAEIGCFKKPEVSDEETEVQSRVLKVEAVKLVFPTGRAATAKARAFVEFFERSFNP